MSLAGMLNKTCTISREAITQNDVTGEIVRTFSSLASGVRCTVQIVTAAQAAGYPEAGETHYDVYFAAGRDIGVGDRITAITGMANMTLDVESDAGDDSGRGPYTRVRCIHKTGGAT